MSTYYRFPYGKNTDGSPRIEREMTSEQYADYKQATAMVTERLRSSATSKSVTWTPVAINFEKLEKIWQKSDHCDNISYPAPGYPERTFATSGQFPIVMYSVLKYFDKEITFEGLRDIAVYGDWHHANGTWHHFVDVVAQAYGLNAVRMSAFYEAYLKIFCGGLVVALMNKEIFPGSKGNKLIIITAFADGRCEYYDPSSFSQPKQMEFEEFQKHCMILWGIDDYARP